ncbi:NUDIX hydrolase [Candidatus Microgenomates bacterium]|nr:MAG: NUDIX hydrolase [Candidatus Microgenomates bacterium]
MRSAQILSTSRIFENMNSDWKTVGKKLAYENPFMAIWEYDVVRPNGKRAPYYVLTRHPFSVIIPLTPDHQTYLVGQYRFAISQYSWEFPMGSVTGKDPLAMAKQELKEETGFIAKTWEEIGSYAVAPGHASQRTHVFIARDLTEGVAEPEEYEFLQLKKLPFTELETMIAKGEIVDGVTLTAVLLLKNYLQKKNQNLPSLLSSLK